VASESVSYPSRRELRDVAARHASRPGGRRAVAAGRARHASSRGEGFGALVGLTALGGLVPGAGLVAAGRRRLGWTLVTLFTLTVLGLAAVVATGSATELGIQLATRPDALLLTAGVAVAVGLAWCLVILVGHVLLRRNRLRTGQRLLSAALVAALMGLVALPSATAARYAMAQRSLVLTVFDASGQRDGALAAPNTQAADPWAGTPRINVLLLGSDAGADRKGTRPDTVIVASIDTHSGDTVLFSLPRNLERVPFPDGSPADKKFPRGFYCEGHQECLLNGIWSWAEQNKDLFPGDDQPGLTATRQAVGEALGLPLDYYALVNLQGFVDVVDAMGGVKINVERKLPMGGIDAHGNHVKPSGYLMPGRRVLNGQDALWYARSRSDSDDYQRMARQRCVVGAAVDQAQPAKLALAFPQLAASAERNVETDISASELDAFIELALRVQKGSLRSLPFTNAVINPSAPDYEGIRQLVQQAIDPAPPAAPAEPSPSIPPSPAPGDTATTAPSEAEAPNPDPEQAVDVTQVCG
jgi:LCP family protein required for cell wall assembly